jgi:integrase
MPRLKLTQRVVDRELVAPDPSKKQTVYWDHELPGFGVLVSGETNVKTYIAQRDLPSGLTRRVTIGNVLEIKHEDARARAGDVLRDLRNGIDPKVKIVNPTLRETLERYLTITKNLRERSKEAYRYAIEGHFGSWLDCKLRDITPKMVEDRYEEIPGEVEARWRAAALKAAALHRARAAKAKTPEEAEEHLEKIKDWKPRSGKAAANGAMRALRAVWNHAATYVPTLPPNPVRLKKRQWHKVPRRKTIVPSHRLPDFHAAVMALENPVARDYLRFLLFTGLRRGEAAALRWEHIDFELGVIRIPPELTKSDEPLDLPMTDYVRALLLERGKKGREAFVFPADSASKHIEEPAHPLGLIAEATGIRVTAHDLRRNYITAAEGTPNITPMAAKALVNHSSGTDVHSGYVVLTPQDLKVPAQRICNTLKRLCGIVAARKQAA